MKKFSNNQNRNKLSLKAVIIIALIMATILALGIFVGSFAKTNRSNGTLILSVNPIIRIDYDENGLVTAVSGKNADGIGIVNSAGALEGLECAEAVQILVREIHSAGYFVDEIDGERRNVYLKVEKGSHLPSGEFVEEVSDGLQRTVDELGVDSSLITIDSNDYGNPILGQGKYVSLEKAKEIALSHAEVDQSLARFTEVDLDVERRYAVYELEFICEGVKYEYEIDAESGKVIKHETEGKKHQSQQNQQGQQTADPDGVLIGEEKAIELALSHAGVETRYVECELDREGGRLVYEVEFKADGYEYDYEIDAESAEILKSHKEFDD